MKAEDAFYSTVQGCDATEVAIKKPLPIKKIKIFLYQQLQII